MRESFTPNPEIPQEIMKILLDEFGQEIVDRLTPEETMTLARLYQHMFDAGCLKEWEIRLGDTNVPERLFEQSQKQNPERLPKTAPAVHLLNRAALSYEVRKRIFTEGTDGTQIWNGEKIDFLLLDIRDLRRADIAGSGDWMINLIAQSLETVASELCREHPGATVMPCRYGGDEFMIAISDMDPAEAMQAFSEGITALTGFYRNDTGEVVAAPTTLNPDKTHIIAFPEGEQEQSLFLEFIKQGVVLTHDDLNRIMESYRTEKRPREGGTPVKSRTD
jgi:GGDEF domain-containing protein